MAQKREHILSVKDVHLGHCIKALNQWARGCFHPRSQSSDRGRHHMHPQCHLATQLRRCQICNTVTSTLQFSLGAISDVSDPRKPYGESDPEASQHILPCSVLLAWEKQFLIRFSDWEDSTL